MEECQIFIKAEDDDGRLKLLKVYLESTMRYDGLCQKYLGHCQKYYTFWLEAH